MLGAAALLAGCAEVPPNAGENPVDPWESFNRQMYAFNQGVDVVAKPVAQAYVDWTPSFMQTGIHNAVDNLFEPSRALNNTLQGAVNDGIGSAFRFLVNSTFGIAGLFDVASEIGLEKKPADFGQTLGKWGVPAGPYMVLPFVGPSTVRDAARYVEEFGTNPLTYALWNEDWYWSAGATFVVFLDGRAQLLQFEGVRQNVVDEYVAVREAYLSIRRKAVEGSSADDGGASELESLTPLDFGDGEDAEADGSAEGASSSDGSVATGGAAANGGKE